MQELLDSGAAGWDGIVVPIERMQHRLARTWSPVGHLNGVANSDELRAAYNTCLPLLTAYHTEIAQNAALCAAYQRIKDTEYAGLQPDSASWSTTRCATSASPVSRWRPNASSASANYGAAVDGAGEVRRERARRHQCLDARGRGSG